MTKAANHIIKIRTIMLFVFAIFCLSTNAQTEQMIEQCGTMENLKELIKKDPALKERMETLEVGTQDWLKTNEMSRIKYIYPPQESSKPKSNNPSVFSLCGYDNTLVATIAAPTAVGQKVSPGPNCVKGGEYVTVTGMVKGNVYRISTCGTNTFDTQLTVYSPAWGGIAEAHNDDYCGIQSEIYFNPLSSGNFDVLVDVFDCQSNSICASLEVELVNTPRAIITIPIVFHVIHGGEALGSGVNVSNAYVLAALTTLNQDFRRLNSGISNVPAAFRGMSDDPLIQFCLATKDPSGNATTGITRIQGPGGSPYSMGAFDANVKPGTIWDRDKYLNIWIANLLNIGGFAQFPGGPANTDGVALDYLGNGEQPYKLGKNASHEVGHWLNLRHIWGDESACAADDFVLDTPRQGNSTTQMTCPTFPKTDACSPKYPGIMFYSYMDYSSDACRNMFTVGQAARMDAALFGQRLAIQTSAACGNTTAVADLGFSSSVSLYPNPSNGIFTTSFTATTIDNYFVEITNTLGQVIYRETLDGFSGVYSRQINISSYGKGIYMLKISSTKNEQIKKVIAY